MVSFTGLFNKLVYLINFIGLFSCEYISFDISLNVLGQSSIDEEIGGVSEIEKVSESERVGESEIDCEAH